MAVRVSLTDQVQIETSGGAVLLEQRFPGRQGRLVFAYLLAHHGRPVPRDELAEALWGDAPTATWEKALSVLVSKLRVLLQESGVDGTEALTSAFGCYQLTLPSDTWIDLAAAAEAAAAAERALADGAVERARIEASTAESLARRTFLPGEEGRWVAEQRDQLREVLVRALDCLAEVRLRTSEPAAAARSAEEIVGLEPFRERGYRLLMQAQSAAGNDAEALRTYERCRRLLVEELGAYPSAETDAIYRRLLDAPPPAATSVEEARPPASPAGSGSRTPARRSRRIVAPAAAIALLVAAGILVVGLTGGSATPSPAPNSVVALDPSGSIAATVPVGARPIAITSGAGALWVANLDDQTVTRVDTSSRRAVRHIAVGGTPTGLAATSATVWVVDDSGNVSSIDPRYDRTVDTRGLATTIGFFGGTVRPALTAFRSVWIASPAGVVLRLNPSSGRVVATVGVGNRPTAIAAGAGSLWVTNGNDGTVTRIDPQTLATRTIPVGNDPAAVAVDDTGAWVANAGDNAVVRLDTDTNAVTATMPVGDGPAAILSTATALWVANLRDGTVMRLDRRSGKVAKTIRLGGAPSALATADGHVWVALAPAPPDLPPEDGARLTTSYDFASLDPASGIWHNHQLCANLVRYPDKAGPAGSRIIPEVAEAVPVPTAGGTTYTFRIRPGFRFSPPSNEVVTARTFKSTIERVVDLRMNSWYASSFSGIVGYQAYVAGKTRGISGIVARGNTLTIRLSRPKGALLANLADSAACAVPLGTPAVGGLNAIPSAGPYYIASYTPRQQLVLERNPNYHGNRPHRLERFVVAIAVDPARALEQVEDGTADYATQLPRHVGLRLESAYGSDSEAARAGHQQYFVSDALGLRVLHMNTSRPLFSDVRLRRAVNYAIDRQALAAEGRRAAEINPFNAGKPTDDYMPPSASGAANFQVYPLNSPDLRRAKRIAGHVRAMAVMYTPNISPWREEAQIVRRNLRPLGIDVQIKEFAMGDFFTRVSSPGEPFDLAVSGWSFASDPVEMLGMYRRRGIGSINLSHFENPAFDRKLAAAARLSGAKRDRAARRLALELQRDLVPAAPFAVTASRDFFSARIGCQTYQPIWGIVLGALCLRP